MSDLNITTKKQKIILHTFSAIIPMLIIGMAYALNDIFPFGDRQILVTDYWHQYFPFLSDHWHRLRDGGSLLWSWSAGGGHDYLSHFAYYMASPLNFLIVLFPHEYLREVLLVFLIIKIGCAGLFMSFFLSHSLKKYDILLPVFSASYALCAFILGYYWNIMWIDTIAIMPLVILGVYALVREGKYLLYIGSLAVAVFANFYIGLFVCIFVAITFFVQCFIAKLSWRQFMQRTITIAICSIIGLGMSAIILLAAYNGLQNSYRSETTFPDFRVIDSFSSVLGNFIAFTPPTSLDGLPNLYSGLLSVMLVPIFVLSKKISVKEKVAYLGMAIFLLLSVNINVLDFIWNGFTLTNMLPFRFSFIASFIVIAMAFKAYMVMDEITKKDVLAMGVAAIFFHLMAIMGDQEFPYIGHSAILAAVYLAIFSFVIYSKNSENSKHLLKYALFLVILIELSVTAYNGVSSVGSTMRDGYPQDYDQIQTLLDMREIPENDFMRTELGRPRTLNSASIYSFDGISFFSSFANVAMSEFMEEIGLIGWPRGNRFTFASTSPLSTAFLNLHYKIIRIYPAAHDEEIMGYWSQPMGDGYLWEHIATEGNNQLFRNLYTLPFGFMVNEDILGYVGDIRNPLMAQNNLFSRATGIEDPLFTFVDIIHVGHQYFEVGRLDFGQYSYELVEGAESGTFRFNYQMPPTINGPVYAFFNFHDANSVRITSEGNQFFRHRVDVGRNYIFSAGTFEEGDIVSFEAESSHRSGLGDIFVATLDQELLRTGLDILAAESLTLTNFSDTTVSGTITVTEPRILYTSIPYAGNWRAFVNGEEEEIVAIGGAMAGVRLGVGTHTVEFRYHNRHVNLGIIISVISVVIYALLHWLNLRGKNIFDSLFNRIFSSDESETKAIYVFFGGVFIIVNWTIYGYLIQAYEFSLATSNALAWIFSTILAFIAYKLWIYKNNDLSGDALSLQIKQFMSVRVTTGLIDLIGMPFLFAIGINSATLGIEGFEAKVVVSGVVALVSFAFRNKIFENKILPSVKKETEDPVEGSLENQQEMDEYFED